LSGELGELAKAMAAMRDRLDGHEHVEHLVRALTHELKSPLTAISGAAELLHEPLPDADRQLFALQIREQADRLHQMVERLLELSKLEQQQTLHQQQPLDLAERVDRVLASHAARLQQRQLVVHWSPTPGIQVLGEPELLDMAISNLLDNAMAFSHVGGAIDMALSVANGQALLDIRDHGPGVPDYALPRLGERFYSTVRPSDNGEPPRKGTGLGLAIVRQIMQLHRGELRIAQAQPGFQATLCLPHAHFTLASHSSSSPH
jgi:two-component system sensor histidine kinase CreC